MTVMSINGLNQKVRRTSINDDDLYIYDIRGDYILKQIPSSHRNNIYEYAVRPGCALLTGLQLKLNFFKSE